MAAHVQNNLETFLARRQQVLDLEATTHRMESLLDRAPAPAFESLYLAAMEFNFETWQRVKGQASNLLAAASLLKQDEGI